jgi:hypothetical protein
MAAELAVPNSTHRRTAAGLRRRYGPNLLLFGIGLVLGLSGVGLGLAKPKSDMLLPGVLFAAASFIPLIPVFLALSGLRRVDVNSDGLSWADGKGKTGCRWDEIAAVYRDETVMNKSVTSRTLRVELANGKAVTFDHRLSDYDTLADTVQRVAAKVLLPVKQAELASGAAAFGPVTLHPDGIAIHKKRFAWPDVEEYTIAHGVLYVFPRGYKGQQNELEVLARIPNYLVLLELLQGLGQDPVAPERSILFRGRK